jgi:hypothetical protein
MEDTISNGIYTAVRPFYCVCKMLGQVSYLYSRAKFTNRITVVHSLFHTVYSTAWALFCVTALGYTLRTLHDCDILPEKLLIASYIYYTISYAASFVCVIHGVICSGSKHSLILGKLSLVDGALFKPHEERRVNRRTMFTSIAEIVILLLFSTATSFYYIYSTEQEECYTTVVQSLECIFTFSNIMAVMRYCNLVLLLHKRFKRVNKYLSSDVNVTCIGSYVADDTPALGHSTCLRAGRKISLYVSSRNPRSNKAIHFYSLRVIFSELNHAIRLINEDCGIPVLATTMWMLVSAVFVVFFTLLDSEHGAYGGISYLMIALCLLTKLSTSCHTAGSEIDASKFFVQKLLLDDALHPKDIEELQMLSVQLNSTTAEYSAYGFFVLNLPFLCSVIGVIISYIVIIVQMK